MPFRSDVYEFFVEGQNKHVSHVLLHIAAPSKPDGEDRGYFFVLVEIDNPESWLLTTLENIIKEGEALYYDYEASGGENQTHFELVIEELNRKARILLEREPDRKIHIAVGSIIGNHLSFVYRGEIIALLAQTTTQGPSFTPIVDEALFPTHLFFSSVIEGEFMPKEAVCIGTPHISKYFSNDRITKMIIDKPARQSASQVQKTLEGIASEYSFGGIVLTTTETVELAKRERAIKNPDLGSHASMEKLLDTRRSTEDTLSPKIFSHLTKSFSNTFKKNPSQEENRRPKGVENYSRGLPPRKKMERIPERSRSESFLIGVGKALVWTGKALGQALYLIVRGLGRLLGIIWSLISNYNGNRQILIDQYKESVKKKRERVANMGIFGKVIIIMIVLGIAILIGSILYVQAKQKTEAAEAVYQIQIEEVTGKREQAESYVIYGENQKALISLNEARATLTSLKPETDEKKAEIQKLVSELDETLFKVQKITKVSPEKIVDLATTNPQAKPDSLVLLENTILAIGGNDSSLYKISIASSMVETKDSETTGKLSHPYPTKDGGQALMTAGDNSLVLYDQKSNTITSRTVEFPNEAPMIADIALYNAKLYALDTKSGTIYRHDPTQLGYTRGSSWVKKLTNPDALKDAVSLSIDGDVYVLTKTGGILKFLGGEQQGFEIIGLDPKLDSATLLETNSAMNNLYILEPSRKRVVVIDKEGNFRKQFQADEWKNPMSLVVTPDEKEAYILDGATVYKFKL